MLTHLVTLYDAVVCGRFSANDGNLSLSVCLVTNLSLFQGDLMGRDHQANWSENGKT